MPVLHRRLTRAGLAVALMRGKSYLSLGGTSMGIAGSVVDPDFFQEYLGIRVEAVDMTELARRIDKELTGIAVNSPADIETALQALA